VGWAAAWITSGGLVVAPTTGALDIDALADLLSDEVIEGVTAVRGFGRWSAEWFVARGLGRGDFCPAGDPAVRRAHQDAAARGGA
jgi:DNA-3-methyladenine glycosylase II